jgi:hypothetical protein
MPAMIAQAEAIDTLESDLESLAIEIEQIHSNITVRIILEIGGRLDAANRELANNKNGRFEKWVTERLQYTPRTARNYINSYRRFGDSEYRERMTPLFPLWLKKRSSLANASRLPR